MQLTSFLGNGCPTWYSDPSTWSSISITPMSTVRSGMNLSDCTTVVPNCMKKMSSTHVLVKPLYVT